VFQKNRGGSGELFGENNEISLGEGKKN
jgi:hypothetical protein